MAGPVNQAAYADEAVSGGRRGYGKSLALLQHLRSVFELNYTQTALIESVWFIAYFFASIPSAFLIERVGYQGSYRHRPAGQGDRRRSIGHRTRLARRYGLQQSFLLTAACELCVLFYALWGARSTDALPAPEVVAPAKA